MKILKFLPIILWLSFCSGCQSLISNELDDSKQINITLTPTKNSTEAVKIYPTSTSTFENEKELIDFVKINQIMTNLRRLTGEEPICVNGECHEITNRETGSEDLQWAKEYVIQEFTRMGYEVEIQYWSRGDYQDQNIVIQKKGSLFPEEKIYFIAHLDGVSGEAPAADDNATGVVCLLELARVLRIHDLGRTVVIIFSTGEEQGMLGSKSYVEKLNQEELSKIKYVINVDTIGYDSNSDGIMQLWSGDQSKELINLMSEIITSSQNGLISQLISGCE